MQVINTYTLINNFKTCAVVIEICLQKLVQTHNTPECKLTRCSHLSLVTILTGKTVNMEKTVAVNNVNSCCTVTDELLTDHREEESVKQYKNCKEGPQKIGRIKDCIEKIVLQVILISIMDTMLTDLVAVLSIIAKTMFLLILKAFYTMVAIPARSASNYFENERVLIIGGCSELGKEIALQLARYNINRITLWDTNVEQLKEVTSEIQQLKSSSKIFTYALPSISKESVQDTINKMKLEAGDVSVLVNAIDNNTNANEKILTAETNSLLNIVQQELTMYTLVRCH